MGPLGVTEQKSKLKYIHNPNASLALTRRHEHTRHCLTNHRFQGPLKTSVPKAEHRFLQGGGDISRGGYFVVGIFVLQMCAKFLFNFQATVQNKPSAKFSHWGAFSPPLCSLTFDLLSVGRGWRRPLKSGLPPWLEGVYMRTVHADVPGRGKGSGESRIRVRDQGIQVHEGIGVCCAPKQIKGLVLDCLGPWGMELRSRSCRNPLKVKNAIL